MDNIKLPNRYGNTVLLVPTENPKQFFLQMDENSAYYRIGFKDSEPPEEGEILFVDPEGGPFIEAGTKISKDLTVESVYKSKEGFIIRMV